MYQFKEEINYKSHFWFDKKWITNMNWKSLLPSAKAIFPVVAVHRNKSGIAFPGETRIAILSGRTEKSVRKGIEALRDFPDLTIEKYTTQRGRRSKRFIFQMKVYKKGRAFPFYKSIIDGGNWSLLKPTSQAVYPVMRSFSFFNYTLYEEEYPDSAGLSIDEDTLFRERICDFCEAEPKLIADMAGISYRSYHDAFEDLQEHGLIEVIDESTFKVFLHPPHSYKCEYLNGEILRKYKKSLLSVEENITGHG